MSDNIYITCEFISHFIVFTLFGPEDLYEEKKFVVSVSALDRLLKVCSACGGTADYEQLQNEGAVYQCHGEITLYMIAVDRNNILG